MKDQSSPRMSPDRGSFALLGTTFRSARFATFLTERKFQRQDFGDSLLTDGKLRRH
jgi:hypothetical protein